MLPTHGPVRLFSADTHLISFFRNSLREQRTSSVTTDPTLCMELGIGVRQWDEVKNLAKGLSLRIPIKAEDKDMLSPLLNHVYYNIVEIRKELGLFNNNVRSFRILVC